MKQYVFDFANDLIAEYKANELMDRRIKRDRIEMVKIIVEDYQAGLMSASEAIAQILKYGEGYAIHRF